MMEMNHAVMGVRSWLEKDGENTMTSAMISVGKQLTIPHRISVSLFGGLIDNWKKSRVEKYEMR
jgi:hypothetical protein